jgi:hypothetical protein
MASGVELMCDSPGCDWTGIKWAAIDREQFIREKERLAKMCASIRDYANRTLIWRHATLPAWSADWIGRTVYEDASGRLFRCDEDGWQAVT